MSLNRFERKKNLPLAVEALGWALGEMGVEEASRRGLRLVIAGGFTERVVYEVSCDIPTLFWCRYVWSIFLKAQGCLRDQRVDVGIRASLMRPPLPPVSSRDDDESLSATPPASCLPEGCSGP